MGAFASIKWTRGVKLRRGAYAHQGDCAKEDKSCSRKGIETPLVDELLENRASDYSYDSDDYQCCRRAKSVVLADFFVSCEQHRRCLAAAHWHTQGFHQVLATLSGDVRKRL